MKYEQYIEFLKEKGFRIEVVPFFAIDTFSILYRKGYIIKKIIGVVQGFLKRFLYLFKLPFVDGIYIHLNVCPLGPPILEWLYLKIAKKTIYDIDDMVFQLNTSKQNNISRFFKSRSRFFLLMKESDFCITCTPTLDSIAKKYNKNTKDISSTINTEKYLPINKYSNESKLIIGWTGSHSTVPYLHLLDEVLIKLSQKYNFKLLVMGATNFKIKGVNIETVPWESSIEIKTLQRIDIGLYPLPDNEWIKGKSGLKALQYMALGLPVVASNLGCNNRVIENNLSGILVNNDIEWFEALSNLIQDASLRKFLGQNARNRVERYFSVNSNKGNYLSIFKKVYL
ncbi:glycosyltransferase family 4 protein [Prochlorococcus marinus XMU1412]|uniref:glycosyltransferase family 4 protein n=1 Tax=Prochlorococcus marinus TaxID=1219 RepID=UPI001AD9BA48|nr:glycosyltransferase family 4 protein [Prochlorococcus marinus]MBO8240546.1 glycosyltransferase family 4 protein [Prochlorococcus marinus XMU1412]